jgi:hypothetical protein
MPDRVAGRGWDEVADTAAWDIVRDSIATVVRALGQHLLADLDTERDAPGCRRIGAAARR